MKRILSIITTALLILVLVLGFALVGVRLFGISPYAVLSGSMEPNYHVGSLIYVTEVDVNTLKEGDPITYVIEGGTVVTHRIIEVLPEYGEDGSVGFKTRGDANKVEDGTPVHSMNVIGKPLFSIPYMGYIAYYIQNPPGSYLAIGLCVVIALMTFLPDLLDKILAEEAATEATVPPAAPSDKAENPPNTAGASPPLEEDSTEQDHPPPGGTPTP